MSAVDQLATTLGWLHRAKTARRRPRRWWQFAPRPPRPIGLINAQMSANPFEFYLLVALTILGLVYTFGISPPRSILQVLPGVSTRIWTGTLALGTLSALIGGLWRRNLERGLAFYQAGYGVSGTACVVYGVAVLIVFGETGLFLALQCFAFTIAAFIRVYEVHRFFKLAEQMVLLRSRKRAVGGDDPSGG